MTRTDDELPAEAQAMLAELSDKQRARAVARLEGKSIRDIAAAEGASKSAVAESLSSPKVRAAVTVIGHGIRIRRNDGSEANILEAVLENLMDLAQNAKRAVIVSSGPFQEVQYVRDDRVRLDATIRFLSMIDPALPAPVVEAERVTESITERVRVTPGKARTKAPRA